MLLVGGGQEYHGPTSERDKEVVERIAKALFARVGNSIEIVTGGMPGIPMDFAFAWRNQGGNRICCIVSEEHLRGGTLHMVAGITYQVVGKTQRERREALTQLPEIKAALFVQGGQYTTDEIIKCQTRGLPTVCFVGSGGASAGLIPYQGDVPNLVEVPDWMKNKDPNASASQLAALFVAELMIHLNK